ncbi:MAG: hypothetical protein GF417_11860 [Candidatus Latescibacteria bacterium]|nr:hypothetical protein [bacterium]MBD3425121.1 hypothetical protein [Candidatus Latescibacterota bacterium]
MPGDVVIKCIILVGVILRFCSSGSRAAGDESAISYGDRLRIRTRAGERVVIADVIGSESLLYHTAGSSVPGNVLWRDLLKLEKEVARSREEGMIAGMKRGAVYGLAGGFIFGLLAGMSDDDSESDGQEMSSGWFELSPVQGGFLLGFAGAAVGSLIGSAAGAADPGTVWKEIQNPVQPEVSIGNGGHVRVGISISFQP